MRRIAVLVLLVIPAMAGSAGRAPAPAAMLAPEAMPAPSGLIANIEYRSTVSLDGPWHVIIDPYDSGYYDYRHQPRKDGYFQRAVAKTPRDLVEYDFEKSDTLMVPGDWNSQRKDLFYYEGTVWYERTFSYHKPAGRRTYLAVGAANYLARVWVNGEPVCEHEGGFTGFNCEVTTLLKDGDNFAVIMVNNQRRRDAVPTDVTDWWNYGGLTRDVELVEVPATFLEDYSVQLARSAPDTIEGWVRLSSGPAPVRVRIPELKIDQQLQTDPTGFAAIRAPMPGLERWSPEHPRLYDVEFEAGGEIVRDRIGFRTVEVRGRDILVNGTPVFLRGVCLHEEAPLRSGRAATAEDATTLLGWVRELSGNFARLAHYPHNRNMVRRDEAGHARPASCCPSPAGGSPVSVSPGAPSSRPQVRGESHAARAGRQEPLRREPVHGPQQHVKPAASTDLQSESRAGHVAAKAMSSAPQSGDVRAGGLGGVQGAARVQGEGRNTRGPSARPGSGQRGSYKPMVKTSAAQRASEGVVVPGIVVTNNATGGKGPCDGHGGGTGTYEGMTGTTGSNSPDGRKPIDKVRHLQRQLWVAAKRSPARRFHALLDRIWRDDVLREAWTRVKRNRGSAGVDRTTLAEIEQRGVEPFLTDLGSALRDGTYRPQPVLRHYIPKADGRQRPLGIPTIRDRVAQMAAKLVLEPIFEADFRASSYGFRPKRNATQALEMLRVHGARGGQPRAGCGHPRLLREHRPDEADAAAGAAHLGSAGAEAAAAVARRGSDGGGAVGGDARGDAPGRRDLAAARQHLPPRPRPGLGGPVCASGHAGPLRG